MSHKRNSRTRRKANQAKAKKMAKKRIAKKTTTSKPSGGKKTTTGVTGIGPVASGSSYASSLGDKKVTTTTTKKSSNTTTKEPTKAQQLAINRIGEGTAKNPDTTIAQVKADNTASMKEAAAERDTKFKQTGGVQTEGGKKTSFTAAEEKKITDAGYSVDGYSSAPAQSNTQLQINKDNQMYGNTVPAGSFGISEEGKALAEQQKAEKAAADKAAADKAVADKAAAAKAEADRLAAEQAAAAKAEADRVAAEQAAAAKAEAERVAAEKAAAAEQARLAKIAEEKRLAEEKNQRMFDPSRLDSDFSIDTYANSLPAGVRNDMMIGGDTRSPLSEAAIAAGALVGGKALLGGGLTIGGASKGLGYKGAQAGFTGMGKTGFDAIKGGAKYVASNKPQILGKGAYSSPTVAGAGRYAGTGTSLGGTQTPGGIIKSIVPGKASRIGFIESQAKVSPGMFDKGVKLANKISEGAYGKSSLANTFRDQLNIGAAPGGGFGSNLGNAFTKAGAATVAGGLNIGATDQASEGAPSGLSRVIAGAADRLMRDTTDFDKRGVGKPIPSVFGLDQTLAGSAINAAAGETGTINQFRKATDNFSDLKNFNNLSNAEKVETAQNVRQFATDSDTVQAVGEGLGLGTDFKTKINNAVDNVQGRLQGVTADRDSLYGVTSDFARDIDTDPDLNPINKFLTAAATDNLGEAGKETAKVNLGLGININNPLGITNETARDIKAAFQDDSPTTEGLNKDQRGFVGSVANRILSGKATDGLREATYGYGGREGATNAGLTEGQPLNFSDILNTAFAMKDNLGTDTTLASQRFDEAKRLVTPGGVTAGSLIRGSIPNFGGARGSTTQPTSLRGTGTTGTTGVTDPTGTTTAPVYETVPSTYTAPTQTGTDNSALEDIQRESYIANLARLGITDLRNMPQFRTQKRTPKRFRSFRRGYF